MDKEKILLAEYTEVCRSFHGISEFRGKLLALLPIVSGAGISILISKNYSIDSSHLWGRWHFRHTRDIGTILLRVARNSGVQMFDNSRRST